MSEFCECKKPHFEKNYVDVQEGGNIVSRNTGLICDDCQLPPDPEEEVDEE